MYDFTNYQIADIPVFMWSMVGVTVALVGYVTVTSTSGGGSEMPTPLQAGGRKTRRKSKNSRNSKK